MRFRLVSLLCACAIVLAGSAAPAAAATAPVAPVDSVVSALVTPTQPVLNDHQELGIWGSRWPAGGSWGGWGYPWPGGAPWWRTTDRTRNWSSTDCVCAWGSPSWGGSWPTSSGSWGYPWWGWGMPLPPPPPPPLPLPLLLPSTIGLGGIGGLGLTGLGGLGPLGSLTLAQAIGLGLGRVTTANNVIFFTPTGGTPIALTAGQTLPGTTLAALFATNPAAFGGLGLGGLGFGFPGLGVGVGGLGGLTGIGIVR